jgi:hypothetical protein
MNVLFNLIFLFIYIYISLIIGIPGTGSNIIINKLILFIGIFIYQFIIGFMSNIYKKHSLKKILKISFSNSLLSIIGYSLYIDLLFMNFISPKYINNQFTNSAIITIFIISTIATSKIINLIINNDFI